MGFAKEQNDVIFITVSLTPSLPGAYAGFLRGGGPTLNFLGIWIYMPRSGMSRAAKLRAVARGVWGHAPQENF